jgi:5-methylcytosine-specific restriction protein A
MRTIPEWRGKHDNAAIPERVKLRCFEREERVCLLCGQTILSGDGTDFHHKVPLADGGEHRESNIYPVHRKCHRLATAQEAHERALNRATVKSHYGLKEPSPGFRKPEGVKFNWKRRRYERADA